MPPGNQASFVDNPQRDFRATRIVAVSVVAWQASVMTLRRAMQIPGSNPPDRIGPIIKKFGSRLDACYQQIISGLGAGDIHQMTLSVVDLL